MTEMNSWQDVLRRSGFIHDAGKADHAFFGLTVGGRYEATLPTLTDHDFTYLHFTSDGKLMVDTELTLDATGVTINNIKVFSTDGTAANSKYGFAMTDVGAADGTKHWQGVGFYDVTNSKFIHGRVMKGDAAANAGYHLSVAGEVVDFNTGAGTDFTPSIGMLAASGSGALPPTAIGGADAIDNSTTELVTGSFEYSFNGTTWDRKRDAGALTDTTLAGTLGSFHNAETGVPISVIMGYDSTGAANAYRAIHVDSSGNVILSSDIEIGAVELKNGADDTRAIIKDGSTFAPTDVALGVADANVLAALGAVAIPTTLTGGNKTVAVAGTAETLGASLATKSIHIRAKATNTSFICVGDSLVDEATNQQIILYANDSIDIPISNRATVYVDVDVGGEGVDYLCFG